jgi:hypothetical protein
MRQACQLSRDDASDFKDVSNMGNEAKDVSKSDQDYKECGIELLN